MRLGFIAILLLSLYGCEFIGGAAVGALGTSAAYEYNAYKNDRELDEDFRSGRISRHDYEARKRQVDKGSITR